MTHWTDKKEVPFKAWYLDDSFRIEEVNIIEIYVTPRLKKVFISSNNVAIPTDDDDLFDSPESAITEGRSYLDSIKNDIDEWTKTYLERQVNLKIAEERFGVSK